MSAPSCRSSASVKMNSFALLNGLRQLAELFRNRHREQQRGDEHRLRHGETPVWGSDPRLTLV